MLLESERAEDLVIAFLCRINDKSELFRRLKERLENLDSRERADFLAKVLTILGLRPMLKEEVLSFVKEVGRMPITVRLEKELVENFPVIGDLVRKGIQEGLQEGIQRGKQEDLIKILEVRFGEVDESLRERIKGIEEVKKLEELLISAIRVNDLEEFKKEIAED